MSYLVLARRWRPQRFDQLVGQPHVAKTILNGLRQGRIAHAYLFSGPRGVGKTTTARLVARALNCTDLRAGEPCGECNSCKAISENRFIDTIEIDAASNTGVDDIRTLREGIRFAPIEGKAKVYVIDEVHMLSPGAFNALLKTLEEPPEHAFFCLATTEVQKIPDTIISRCQRFDFRRVPVSEIREHLINICESDNISFDIDALDVIARRADGSVRDSLSLLDQVVAYSGGDVKKKETIEVVGEIRHDQYYKALDLVNSKSVADAFKLDEDLAYTGTDPQDFLTGLENYLIQLLQALSLGVDNVDIPLEARDEFAQLLDQFSSNDLIRLLQYTTNAELDVKRNYNPRVRLQLLLVRFAAFEKSVVLAEVIDKIKSFELESATGSRYSNRAAPRFAQQKKKAENLRRSESHTPPVRKDPINAGESPNKKVTKDSPEQESALSQPIENSLKYIQDNWAAICVEISEKYNPRGKMLVYTGFPMKYENKILTIHFRSEAHLANGKACRQAIAKQLHQITGPIDLDLRVGDISENTATEPATDSEPTVQLVIDRWNAKVIS